MVKDDKAYFISKVCNNLYTPEDIRVLMVLRDKRKVYCEEAPYASEGMTLNEIHLEVHPWARKPTLPHARYNKVWLDNVLELIRQRLIADVELDEGKVKCITQKGINLLKTLEKKYDEKLKEDELKEDKKEKKKENKKTSKEIDQDEIKKRREEVLKKYS